MLGSVELMMVKFLMVEAWGCQMEKSKGDEQE
jgi:hypothetical protein